MSCHRECLVDFLAGNPVVLPASQKTARRQEWASSGFLLPFSGLLSLFYLPIGFRPRRHQPAIRETRSGRISCWIGDWDHAAAWVTWSRGHVVIQSSSHPVTKRSGGGIDFGRAGHTGNYELRIKNYSPVAHSKIKIRKLPRKPLA